MLVELGMYLALRFERMDLQLMLCYSKGHASVSGQLHTGAQCTEGCTAESLLA